MIARAEGRATQALFWVRLGASNQHPNNNALLAGSTASLLMVSG